MHKLMTHCPICQCRSAVFCWLTVSSDFRDTSYTKCRNR